MALDATPYRDSSSENITLGSVARRRRRARPGDGNEPPVKEVGERCVWANCNCKFSSDRGLLLFDSEGVGMVKKLFPSAGPDRLIGADG